MQFEKDWGAMFISSVSLMRVAHQILIYECYIHTLTPNIRENIFVDTEIKSFIAKVEFLNH